MYPIPDSKGQLEDELKLKPFQVHSVPSPDLQVQSNPAGIT